MSMNDKKTPRSISGYIEGLEDAKHIPSGFCNEIGYSTLEQATRYAENGICQVLLLLVCVIGMSTTSAFPTIMNFNLNTIQCQFQIFYENRRTLNNVVCMCSIIGGIATSFTADAASRKWSLIACLILHAIGCGVITLINTFKQFLYFRALISFTSSSITAMIVTYLSEFQLRYYRGSVITCLQFGWLFGVLAIPFVSTSMWRYQTRLIMIPSLLSAFLLTFFPESPRFLLSRRRPKKALRALQFIFSVNTGKSKSDYPIRHLIDNKNPTSLRRRSVVKHYVSPGSEPQFICIPIIMFSQFIFMFSYCTVTFWFPIMNQRLPGIFPLLNNTQIPQDCVVGFYVSPLRRNISGIGRDTLKFIRSQSNNFRKTPNETAESLCDSYSQENLFSNINTMTNVITCLPILIFTVLKIDSIGRKFFIMLAHFVAACLSFASFYMHSDTQKDLLYACIFDSLIILSIAVAQCLAVELFPTRIRVFGVAIVSASGSLGLMHAANGGIFIYDMRCITLFAFCAICLEISGIALMTLPDTAGINLR